MGGTSADIGIVTEAGVGEASARDTWIGGYPLLVPMLDVHTIGAGGGSIAYVDDGGAFRVGPRSAGATPGPACYGAGGQEPTISDAHVVLGRLDPERFLGGRMTLDRDAAVEVVQRLADELALGLAETAEGILTIANSNMARAIRSRTIEKGHDPREFALVAFGGAGPLHANAVAELMGSFPVIVPPSPGLLCALGDLVADFRNEFARTLIRLTAEAGAEEIDAVLAELEGRARQWMDAQGIDPAQQTVSFHADMRYHGQGYEIPVPIGDDLDERFNALHEQLYGFRMPDTPSEIVNLRAVGTGDRPKPELPEGELHGPDPGGDGPVYERSQLQPGNRLSGPAVITEFDSTTVVLEGYEAEVDRFYNILIRPEGQK
jgi:N-methylhydantoinase A